MSKEKIAFCLFCLLPIDYFLAVFKGFGGWPTGSAIFAEEFNAIVLIFGEDPGVSQTAGSREFVP